MTDRRRNLTIKYCGGCNPGYDRVAAADRITRRLDGSSRWVVDSHRPPDMVASVCGCDCACADVRASARIPVIRISSMADIDALTDRLHEAVSTLSP